MANQSIYNAFDRMWQHTVAKIGTKADLNHTHNYAGSSSAGGAATTALACTGNSATATKATQDASGNDIENTYMTKADPTGTGSLSMNRLADSTIGDFSVALGANCTASGEASYAEGDGTTASGYSSHTEGYYTTAYGFGSHAEGASTNRASVIIDPESVDDDAIINAWNTSKFTLAFGPASHAEGCNTLALGTHSHAEGENTIASGYRSHAEGRYTTASGNYSHAEGHGTKASGNYSHAEGYGTVAASDSQHVQGKYNISDEENIYAFIIGNGTENDDGTMTRSNAMTVDWEGDVRANHFIVPNGSAIRGTSTTGEEHGMAYISNADNLMLGAYSESGHSGNTYVNAYNGEVYLRNKNRSLLWQAYDGDTDYNAVLRCTVDGKAACGSPSYRWYKLFATTTTIGTSDEREKSDIMSIADYPVTYSADNEGNVFEQLFDKLEPKTYTLNAESTGEIRIGFVAQDIVKSLEELGLSEDDLGVIDHGYWTDEETGEERDRYGLAYTEFIALNTYMIQKQKARITELETQLSDQEERIAKLEELVNNN